MKNPFKKAAALSEAEKALKTWGVQYEKQADGSLLVPGNMFIFFKGLTSLPDLRQVKVGGSFICDNNQLTSLAGAPQTVGGYFFCGNNQLTSLEGAPQSVGGDFWCHNNRLTSLEHAPHTVTGNFRCDHNQLTSLEHAPHSVTGDFSCDGNQLTSLEGAPPNFIRMISDFGQFSSWQEVPENLRVSPETKARLEQHVTAATVLQFAMRVRGALKLRSKAFRA